MAAPGQAPEMKLFLNQTQSGEQVYYPGQEVSGTIEIVTREPKWYQYAGVGLEGKGTVHWTETHSTGVGEDREEETVSYSDNETYVDLIVIVWGNKEAPQPTKLDPGTFTFPFKFTIPADCPPTFNTYTGRIKYQLYGVIASQVNEYKIETPLTMNCLIDLNLQPSLLEPVEQSTLKDIITCCCIKSGAAHITCKIPKKGFCVSQEKVPIMCECRNGSSREITLRVELVQSTVYNARGHTKGSSDTIGNFSCRIRPSQNETKSVEFDLPPTIRMPFSSRIIKVAHIMNIRVTHALGISIVAPPHISIPITIGNVPFRGPTQLGSPLSPQDQLLSNGVVPSCPPLDSAPPEYPVELDVKALLLGRK